MTGQLWHHEYNFLLNFINHFFLINYIDRNHGREKGSPTQDEDVSQVLN